MKAAHYEMLLSAVRDVLEDSAYGQNHRGEPGICVPSLTWDALCDVVEQIDDHAWRKEKRGNCK